MEQCFSDKVIQFYLAQSYSTLLQSLPAVLLAVTIQKSENSESRNMFHLLNSKSQVWKTAFNAEWMSQWIGKLNDQILNWTQIQHLLCSSADMKAVHWWNLSLLSTRHTDIETHSLSHLFEQTEKNHLQSHVSMNFWTEIDQTETKEKQVLDCMWVYVYKFDKHDQLLKCKARLVVHEDQQIKIRLVDIYAVILAVCSFWTFMTIAACFDLELKQYDTVNAFVHALLINKIYMRMSLNYEKSRKILCLNKTVYELHESPVLWQWLLTETLMNIDFKSISHESCCLTCNEILIFFYVNDIVLAYWKSQKKKKKTKNLIVWLQNYYNILKEEDFQWFLSIAVYCDHRQKCLWLNQAAYINKIIKLASTE